MYILIQIIQFPKVIFFTNFDQMPYVNTTQIIVMKGLSEHTRHKILLYIYWQ